MSTTQQKPKQTSRWGSLLSGAVAGLESRLDTILTDDNEASAKSRLAEAEAKNAAAAAAAAAARPVESNTLTTAPAAPDLSRSPSKNRANDRLQERLAKAMASRSSSQAPSEMSSPALAATSFIGAESPRTSVDSRRSLDASRAANAGADSEREKLGSSVDSLPSKEVPLPSVNGTVSTLSSSKLPINPARHSEDSAPRYSKDVEDGVAFDGPKISLESQGARKSAAELEVELIHLRAQREETDKQRQEEMDTVLERVDALQSKLQYLAKEAVAAAKEANAQADQGSLQRTIAEKDEKIALLMQEGQVLSKNEMRHLTNVRKLTAQMAVETRTSADLKKELAKMKQSEGAIKARMSRLEQSEKLNAAKATRASQMESELASLKLDLSSKESAITALKRRLADAEKALEQVDRDNKNVSSLADIRRMRDLEDEVANGKIEKKLAEDRAKAEAMRLTQQLEQHTDRSQATELELRTEIKSLEARMEALRLRAEEASSDQMGDSQAKLLRQIENLQTQYSLAAENWRTIEGSLNARLTATEKERDEAIRREADLRKKARDMGLRARKLEEELEKGSEKNAALTGELAEQKDLLQKLHTRLTASDKALAEARLDFEQQRQTLEASLSARLEEERSRRASNSVSTHGRSKRASSPSSTYRKTSAVDAILQPLSRKASRAADSSSSLNQHYTHSRRSSAIPPDPRGGVDYVTSHASMSRKPSALSLAHYNGITSPPIVSPPSMDIPPTPSITTEGPGDDDEDAAAFDRHSSGRGTVADVISATTVHTGPSVQLVERMSSSIRRLEAEKAAHRDELARLQAQRDEARDGLVRMVEEAERGRALEGKVRGLEGEMRKREERYEACLEMLGEREEEVLELREDLKEMKRVYRELAEKMGRE